MLIEHEGIAPRLAEDVYVAPNAVVSGDVRIGEGSRILFGAVVTAEAGSVVLGRNCIVMEHSLIRGRQGHPCRLGDHVLVGPHTHINGATIEDDVFLATGASVFPGATIGARSEVRINGVVHVNSSLPGDGVVPIGWVAVGDPARILPPQSHDELWETQRGLDFPGTLYGVQRAESGFTAMPEITGGYSELFGRHRGDVIVDRSG